MDRIWARIVKKHKMIDQRTYECTRDEVEAALREACRDMDVPAPIWLQKQRDEFERFGMTAFGSECFFEAIKFDRLELSYLSEDGNTQGRRDPRNDFSDY